VRGYRVNLDEVSQALLRDDRVSQALAGMLKLPTGDNAVGVAVVLKDAAGAAVIDDIVAALAKRLPVYMLPQHGMICDGFPKLPSGKTDARRTIALLADGVNRYGSRWLTLAGGVVGPAR
jgi:acyl-coenzyme A synthetase/AMP-(fatty) acid ligase